RGVLRLRLLHDREDPLGAFVDRRAGDDAVRSRLFLAHPDRTDDAAAAKALPGLDKLGYGRRFADDDVVPPEHRERLRTDERARLQDGVAVAFSLLLHHDAHRRKALGPLEKVDVLLAELDRKTALEPLVWPEIRVQRFLPGRVHDHHSRDP